jgi:hypothetical protein
MAEAGSKMAAALAALPPNARITLLAHIEGGTSAEYIAGWLTRWGSPVSATTVKDYRRRLRDQQAGVA